MASEHMNISFKIKVHGTFIYTVYKYICILSNLKMKISFTLNWSLVQNCTGTSTPQGHRGHRSNLGRVT